MKEKVLKFKDASFMFGMEGDGVCNGSLVPEEICSTDLNGLQGNFCLTHR